MFFSLLNEKILRDMTETGPVYQYVYGEEKKKIVLDLRGTIDKDLARNSIKLKHSTPQIDTVEEALNRAPIFLNAIKHRGYKNILFVGHCNGDQDNWILDPALDRVIHALPPERAGSTEVVDPNIMLQFLPIIHREFGYKGGLGCTVSADPRFREVMHAVQVRAGLQKHMIGTTPQYRHGMTAEELELQPSDVKFDAVVFLGVPKHNNEPFNLDMVKEAWSSVTTEDAEFIDLYYGAPDANKFVGAEKKDHSADLQVAWTTRAQWENDFQKDGGRPEEYDIFDKMISIY